MKIHLSELKGDPVETVDATPPVPPRLSRKRAAYAALPIAGLILFAGYGLLGNEGAQADTQPLPVVTVSQPIEKYVVLWDDYVGRFEASHSAEASLAAARAQAQARRLDVEFTQVRAPISGRVSDRRIDIGNLVSGDSAASGGWQVDAAKVAAR